MGHRSVRVVLVLLLLGLLAWLIVLRERKPASVDLGAWAAPAWVMEAERVVYTSGDRECVVEREGDSFAIRAPFADRADPTRVLQTLQAATRLRPTRVLPEADPVDYGLRPARHRFVATSASGESWTIAFGDTVPVGGQVYARVETTRGSDRAPGGNEPAGAGKNRDVGGGNAGGSEPVGSADTGPVLLVREFGARRDFYPPAEELRDRVALPLRGPVVDSLWVLAGPGRLRAVREAREFWACLEPAGLELDPLPIHRVLRDLRLPTIREFLPAGTNPAHFGLVPPRATWIVFQEARAETVRVGAATATGDGVYVMPSGREAIGVLPSDTYRPLVDGWPALASRRLTYHEVASIERIEFTGSSAAYARADSGWVRLPEGRRVRNVPALLRDLENLLALQWERYPLTPVLPLASAETLVVRIVPATSAASPADPRAVGPEIVTLARAGADGVVLARSDRRTPWGQVPATQFEVWAYRRTHPDL